MVFSLLLNFILKELIDSVIHTLYIVEVWNNLKDHCTQSPTPCYQTCLHQWQECTLQSACMYFPANEYVGFPIANETNIQKSCWGKKLVYFALAKITIWFFLYSIPKYPFVRMVGTPCPKAICFKNMILTSRQQVNFMIFTSFLNKQDCHLVLVKLV